MMMKQNMGAADRIIRVGLAAVLGYLAFVTSGLWVWLTGGLAAVMLVTSAAGLCPLYALFGISTCPVKSPRATR
jgi:hypothetical protein